MKTFIYLSAMLLVLSGGLAACAVQGQSGDWAQKAAPAPDENTHDHGGY